MPYASSGTMPRLFPYFSVRTFALLCLLIGPWTVSLCAQQPPPTKAPQAAEKSSEPELPARLEFLETSVRFEADGSSRKEVHARVKINSELGVQQFARLNFDYNRAFERVQIPQVHVTHASGGTAEILPGAITDRPNPAVIHAPAYQDVRVKSVRILGLQPGDTLEYRVITVVSRAALAQEFYFTHSFDHAGVVSRESFTLDVPAGRKIQLSINPATPASASETTGAGETARTIYRWENISPKAEAAPKGEVDSDKNSDKNAATDSADVALSTFSSWGALNTRLRTQFDQPAVKGNSIKKAAELTATLTSYTKRLEAIYDFVAQKIILIDLPLGATGYLARNPDEILSSGYGTQEDKFAILNAMLSAFDRGAVPVFASTSENLSGQPPRPSLFTHLLVEILVKPPTEFVTEPGIPGQHAKCPGCGQVLWVDPALDIAPMGMIASSFRGKPALQLGQLGENESVPGLSRVPNELPFPASQKVSVNASLSADGNLRAKVHYALRGDNELLLRLAFRQTPQEKWSGVAQLLALSDGFRGKIVSVSASNPMATHEPFSIDYEIAMPKFVDWSKKPVRIPALLPQVGLPEPAAKTSAGSPIDLGTPLEVETRATLKLPVGVVGEVPAGVAVERDYATFSSEYSRAPSIIRASRHIKFLLREVPAWRAADYNAFLRAVQNDSAQEFTLVSTGQTIGRSQTAKARTERVK
ncbi:MAG TPA: DUF3857 domain-containing protein, partial [Candidatus Eremiobacteraceae bacterium]|nr:DUF3857 domain-containing protein [Candidatus Eremiobacteraceae bacterium]